ncbi:ABC transporter permease [Alloscardovia macacae]|uniref:ABC transporter permease n=1 Tax=Alloscardovia macacae TaxID=1160091 RepID=A0A1Y2SV02_9BIFI|nr:ABC transporter permease [Alloscardovia macacae]OTA26725.1 ABC transporter permease [Alloscardovia macacae]OTA29591.1 ABC transporter permease [Alloscardovia macacae]
MYFMRMIIRSLTQELRKRLLMGLTVLLAATVSTAMLGVVFDVGDKLTDELSTYGSNITVRPKSDAVLSELYSSSSTSTPSSAKTDPTSFIHESDLAKMKTIFWAYNILNFAPQLTHHVTVNGVENTPVVGTWFHKTLNLSTGETTVVGLKGMRNWWQVQGSWASDDDSQNGEPQAMVGTTFASEHNVHVGDELQIGSDDQKAKVTGIFTSGDDDDKAVFTTTTLLQNVTGLVDSVNYVEVKALTTPENDLARKVEKSPEAVSKTEWETWYCTAYVSSIAYQIEEVIPGAVAKQVRQVAALQGNVLRKTQAIMIVMTVLTLLAATIAVANLMAAATAERSGEIALRKAIGAKNSEVMRFILAETGIICALGAVLGALLGTGVAQAIGQVVFHAGIVMRPMVFVLVAVLLALTVLLASVSALRSILHVKPAEVLHGR